MAIGWQLSVISIKKSSDDHDGGDDLREGLHLELGGQDDGAEDDDLLHLGLHEVMTMMVGTVFGRQSPAVARGERLRRKMGSTICP